MLSSSTLPLVPSSLLVCNEGPHWDSLTTAVSSWDLDIVSGGRILPREHQEAVGGRKLVERLLTAYPTQTTTSPRRIAGSQRISNSVVAGLA